MADVTYCTKIDCPYTDCRKHLTRLAEVEDMEQVWVSDCSHFCVRNIEREIEEKYGEVMVNG